MSKTIFVRIAHKTGIESFWRCGMQFSRAWRDVVADAATFSRLKQEQVLEVSETKPDDFEADAPAGDSAAVVSVEDLVSGTPVAAPGEAEIGAAVVADTAPAVESVSNGEAGAIDPAKVKPVAANAANEAPVKPADPFEVAEAIRHAVAQLDKADASLWTASGKAKLDAISALTGWPVSALERDGALEAK